MNAQDRTARTEPSSDEAMDRVKALIDNARAAMAGIARADQQRIDELVAAVAWSLYKPENARRLAQMAVEDTGIGNVEDKVIKNQRKTFGALRDLLRAKTVGVIESDAGNGMVRYGKSVPRGTWRSR